VLFGRAFDVPGSLAKLSGRCAPCAIVVFFV
jgi:hypothetical protein